MPLNTTGSGNHKSPCTLRTLNQCWSKWTRVNSDFIDLFSKRFIWLAWVTNNLVAGAASGYD